MSLLPRHSLRLFLVRHGQVAANRDYRYVGDRDDPLTELGRRQAAAVASTLGALRDVDGPLRVRRVLSSPRLRALDTARAIGAAMGLEVETEPRLVEQSFGEWEGLTREQVRGLSAQQAGHLARVDGDPEIAPPGGESLGAAQRRVVGLVAELAQAAVDRPGGVVLVGHVGPIKTLVAAALDLPLLELRRLFLDLATVTVIDWGEPPVLRLFNDHAHLGFERARWL